MSGTKTHRTRPNDHTTTLCGKSVMGSLSLRGTRFSRGLDVVADGQAPTCKGCVRSEARARRFRAGDAFDYPGPLGC
jgi:hypothetical protein